MFEPVPAVPPVVAPEPLSFSTSLVVVSGTPFLAYVRDFCVVLSTLRSALTCTCALPAPSVEASSALSCDSSLRSNWACAACLVAAMPPALAPSPCGHSSWPETSVIVTLSDFRPLTDEAVSCAMPRTAPGSSVSAELPSMTAAVAVDCWSWKRSSCGQHELHGGARDALHAIDRAGDLALQRALVVHLVLELRGAELALVEQLPAGLLAAGEVRRRPRRARSAPATSGPC